MMKKNVVIFLCLFFVCGFLHRSQASEVLTKDQIERVKSFKLLLKDVDGKTLQHTIRELEKTQFPKLNLQLKEAMARVYHDILREQPAMSLKQKEWLYSKVSLNMAYLQFIGPKEVTRTSNGLDKMIRSKLKEHLPADIYTSAGFHAVID